LSSHPASSARVEDPTSSDRDDAAAGDGIVTPVVVHGNGFVAAFCAGLGFGAAAGRRGPAELVLTEQSGAVVSLLVRLAFGAVDVPVVAAGVDVAVVLYAVLSLTVVRMAPVALPAGADGAVTIIGSTVLLSVVLHGLTAAPLVSWYERTLARR
jgi:hypothetical protein